MDIKAEGSMGSSKSFVFWLYSSAWKVSATDWRNKGKDKLHTAITVHYWTFLLLILDISTANLGYYRGKIN